MTGALVKLFENVNKSTLFYVPLKWQFEAGVCFTNIMTTFFVAQGKTTYFVPFPLNVNLSSSILGGSTITKITRKP